MNAEPKAWQYVSGGDGGGGGPVGDWIDCGGYAAVSFDWYWAAVAATVGAVYVEGTNDPAKGANSIIRFQGLSFWLRSTGVYSTAGNVIGATADGCGIVVKNPLAFMRSVAPVSAGGAAAQFNCFAALRAQAG